MNGKQKGKRGELEFSHWLKDRGIEARRGQQFCGTPDSPDVISSLPVHWEIKRVEKINIDKAMDQSIRECGGVTPVVAHRRNNKEWLVTLRAEDFLRMLVSLPAPLHGQNSDDHKSDQSTPHRPCDQPNGQLSGSQSPS